MKRAIILLLLLALLPAIVHAVPLKKVLLVVPDELNITPWAQLAVAGMINLGGGSYNSLFMTMKAESLAVEFARARASGEYGFVIFIVESTAHLTANAAHGAGANAKYCSFGGSNTPIGIPTLVLSRASCARVAGVTYSGCASPGNWTYTATGTGSAWDSLRARTSEGDIILWNHGLSTNALSKQTLDIDQTPESAYPWTLDVWVDRGSATPPGQGATILAWHVHATAYDAAQLPGQGQDSVIYYYPHFQYLETLSWDRGAKYIATLLKQYDCIREIPVGVTMDDLWFNSIFTALDSTATKFQLRTNNLLDWCHANGVHIMLNTQYCNVQTAKCLATMQRYASSPYIHYGYHFHSLYDSDAKTNTYSVFWTWGDDAGEKALPLNRDIAREMSLIDAAGMGQYMNKTYIFAQGDYNGIAGYERTDTIFTALAANEIKKFLLQSTYPGYWISGNLHYTIFYPHRRYPWPLPAWTGKSGTAYTDIKLLNEYLLCGVSVDSDTAFASAALMSDSLINVTTWGSAAKFYRYFGRTLLNNGRNKDGQTYGGYTESFANYPYRYNMEDVGLVFTGHHRDVAIRRNGTYYNMYLEWLQHFIGNLRAYNNLARRDNPQTGDTFRSVPMDEMLQLASEQRKAPR